MIRRLARPGVLLGALLMALSACGDETTRRVADGEPARGPDLMRAYGCHACHMIPGVPGADALVGPPLIHWRHRVFIAGRVANTPDNLVRWIMEPRAFDERTAMPDMGVTEADARDIAAYLFTLE